MARPASSGSPLYIQIDPKLKAQLMALASKRGMTLTDLVTPILQGSLKKFADSQTAS